MFSTEQEMSKKFEKFLKSNYGNAYIKEYSGLFGIPDFVSYSKMNDQMSIVSFELKLKDWKQAARQAFRYKSFSNVSYVVLPSHTFNNALSNISIFEKYNIGLAVFSNKSEFNILFRPKNSKPFSDTLNKKMLNYLKISRKKGKNLELLSDIN